MIQAKNLSKRYGNKLAVDDVSLMVKTGRVTGFLGPNGAGKSTTMRLMLGLDAGKGETLFDGKPLHSHNHPATKVGILLEAKAFHPTRTARNHLRVLATAGNIPVARVDEVLDIVGIRDVADKKPGKFSLGMSQRLGIAAAILGKPKYLILDEPGNGLDPEGIAWLREFLKSYASRGNGVLVSSHLLSEMALLADDIVVIGKGKMITQKSREELLGGDHSGVFVRTTKRAQLKKILKQRKLAFSEINGGLRIVGVKPDDIGRIAFETNLPILELAPYSASLEDTFLELTADSSEYKTKSGDVS